VSKPLVCTLPGHGPEGVCTCCLGCIALRAERDRARSDNEAYEKACETLRAERDEARALLGECFDQIESDHPRTIHPGSLLARIDAFLKGKE
jgi:hypothetical protein